MCSVFTGDAAISYKGKDMSRLFHRIDHDEVVSDAYRMNSATPRAFLRWAGSKRSHLAHFIDFLPRRFDTYREPFLGSGALFFLLQPHRATLTDACVPLVKTFQAVRDNVDGVLRHLRHLKPDRELFYKIRAKPGRGRYRRAAEFIYLNKTCWNGLYRVNSSGQFNVPYGAPKTSNMVVDEKNLRACAVALQPNQVRLSAGDYEDSLSSTNPGDLVYLDPPYVTGHNNNGFIDYNETLFSWRDQERLADIAHELARIGAHVIITNAYHQDLIRLYKGFSVRPFERHSTLASDSTKRRRVQEAILCSDGNKY